MLKSFRLILAIGALVALLRLSGLPAHSAESGTGVYLMGYNSSMAGYLSPPGFYLRNDFYWYQGNAKLLPLSGRIEANQRTRLFLDLVTFSYVSPLKFLEANYAAAVAWAPYANTFIKGQVQAGNVFDATREGDYTGVGDLGLTPLILGWHTEYFHITATGNVFVPVGSYNTNRLLSSPSPACERRELG